MTDFLVAPNWIWLETSRWREKKNISNDDVSSLQQSDYPYYENIPSIKIPMDMMEQEPFLSDKASDSE